MAITPSMNLLID